MVKDGGVTLSSITLLQERFRQLQRMKELRQERELMKALMPKSQRCHAVERRSAAFSGRERASPATPPARPHCQLALSLWPDSQTSKRKESNHSPAVHLVSSSPELNLESCDSDIDVDTSLRL